MQLIISLRDIKGNMGFKKTKKKKKKNKKKKKQLKLERVDEATSEETADTSTSMENNPRFFLFHFFPFIIFSPAKHMQEEVNFVSLDGLGIS